MDQYDEEEFPRSEEETDLLPRKDFEKVARQWMKILKRHGFAPQHADTTWSDAIEKSLGGFLGDVEPKKIAETAKKIPVFDELNLITLKCAIVFAGHLPCTSLYANECLNSIRATLVDMIIAMGYMTKDDAYRATPHLYSHTDWDSYPLCRKMRQIPLFARIFNHLTFKKI